MTIWWSPPTCSKAGSPRRYADVTPRVIRQPDGSEVWTFNGAIIPNIGLNAVAGRPREEYGIEPDRLRRDATGMLRHPRADQGHERRRCARVDVLPVLPGVLRAGCSPRTADKDLALAIVQAYNDWHIDEWCGAYPGRFIPMALPVLWDPELCAEEIRRVAAKGCHSVTFTENPATLGFPSFHDAYWDPMWRALCGRPTRCCRSTSGRRASSR